MNDPNDHPQQHDEGEIDVADPKPKPPTTAIAKSLGASLAIQSVGELMQLAEVLFKGGASQIQGLGRPEAVAHVILAGAEVGFSPTQALGTIMLLDGKTTIYGDGALALVRASGLLEGEVNETVDGDGDDRHATCKIRRKSESEKTFTFSMGEARRAGLIDRAKGKGPWATYPDRMLKMRARGFALRDLFSDVLRGLSIYEDVKDESVVNTEVTVRGTTATPPAAAGQPEQGARQQGTSESSVATAGQKNKAEPVAQQPATAPAAIAAHNPDGPVTTDQLNELLGLRQLVMTGKAIANDRDAVTAEWNRILAPYSVTSAKQLTTSQAADLIEQLGKANDPFTHPPSAPGGGS